jgi:ABC-type sugar transport system ATPase subunit
MTEGGLTEAMLGRTLPEFVEMHHDRSQDGPVALTADALIGPRLRSVSLEVREGEVTGVTGLDGCGKSELGRFLAGAQVPIAGEVTTPGTTGGIGSPAKAAAAGIAYVPSERRIDGAVLTFSAAENVTLPELKSFFVRGRLRHGREHDETLQWMTSLGVVPPDPQLRFEQFSGGNQQKLVIAKCLRLRPKVLVLDEPIQGVDVGAAHDIFSLIEDAAKAGTAVIVLSTEWEYLARACDRILILDRGHMKAELYRSEVTEDSVAAAVLRASKAQPVPTGENANA